MCDNELERTFDLTKILLSYKLDLSLSQLINPNNVNTENNDVQIYIDDRKNIFIILFIQIINSILNRQVIFEWKKVWREYENKTENNLHFGSIIRIIQQTK